MIIYYIDNNNFKSYYFYCKNDKITLLFDSIKYLIFNSTIIHFHTNNLL